MTSRPFYRRVDFWVAIGCGAASGSIATILLPDDWHSRVAITAAYVLGFIAARFQP